MATEEKGLHVADVKVSVNNMITQRFRAIHPSANGRIMISNSIRNM
jgi:hypothetical protein